MASHAVLPPCDLCSSPAAVRCVECATSAGDGGFEHLCDVDDAALHVGKRQAHTRTRLEGAEPLVATTSVESAMQPLASPPPLLRSASTSRAISPQPPVLPPSLGSPLSSPMPASFALGQLSASSSLARLSLNGGSTNDNGTTAVTSGRLGLSGARPPRGSVLLPRGSEFAASTSGGGVIAPSGAVAALRQRGSLLLGGSSPASSRRSSSLLLPRDRASSSARICHICDSAPATVYCDTCKRDRSLSSSQYCTSCGDDFHTSKRLEFHFRTSMEEALVALTNEAELQQVTAGSLMSSPASGSISASTGEDEFDADLLMSSAILRRRRLTVTAKDVPLPPSPAQQLPTSIQAALVQTTLPPPAPFLLDNLVYPSPKEHQAATIIQKTYRGYSVRALRKPTQPVVRFAPTTLSRPVSLLVPRKLSAGLPPLSVSPFEAGSPSNAVVASVATPTFASTMIGTPKLSAMTLPHSSNVSPRLPTFSLSVAPPRPTTAPPSSSSGTSSASPAVVRALPTVEEHQAAVRIQKLYRGVSVRRRGRKSASSAAAATATALAAAAPKLAPPAQTLSAPKVASAKAAPRVAPARSRTRPSSPTTTQPPQPLQQSLSPGGLKKASRSKAPPQPMLQKSLTFTASSAGGFMAAAMARRPSASNAVTAASANASYVASLPPSASPSAAPSPAISPQPSPQIDFFTPPLHPSLSNHTSASSTTPSTPATTAVAPSTALGLVSEKSLALFVTKLDVLESRIRKEALSLHEQKAAFEARKAEAAAQQHKDAEAQASEWAARRAELELREQQDELRRQKAEEALEAKRVDLELRATEERARREREFERRLALDQAQRAAAEKAAQEREATALRLAAEAQARAREEMEADLAKAKDRLLAELRQQASAELADQLAQEATRKQVQAVQLKRAQRETQLQQRAAERHSLDLQRERMREEELQKLIGFAGLTTQQRLLLQARMAALATEEAQTRALMAPTPIGSPLSSPMASPAASTNTSPTKPPWTTQPGPTAMTPRAPSASPASNRPASAAPGSSFRPAPSPMASPQASPPLRAAHSMSYGGAPHGSPPTSAARLSRWPSGGLAASLGFSGPLALPSGHQAPTNPWSSPVSSHGVNPHFNPSPSPSPSAAASNQPRSYFDGFLAATALAAQLHHLPAGMRAPPIPHAQSHDFSASHGLSQFSPAGSPQVRGHRPHSASCMPAPFDSPASTGLFKPAPPPPPSAAHLHSRSAFGSGDHLADVDELGFLLQASGDFDPPSTHPHAHALFAASTNGHARASSAATVQLGRAPSVAFHAPPPAASPHQPRLGGRGARQQSRITNSGDVD